MLPGSGVNIGIVDVAGVRVPSTREIQFDPEEVSDLSAFRDRIASAHLLIDGRVIARGTAERRFGFVTEAKQLWRVRVDRAGSPPPYALPENGIVEIVLQHREDGELRLPLARWTREPISIEPLQPPLTRPIARHESEGEHHAHY